MRAFTKEYRVQGFAFATLCAIALAAHPARGYSPTNGGSAKANDRSAAGPRILDADLKAMAKQLARPGIAAPAPKSAAGPAPVRAAAVPSLPGQLKAKPWAALPVPGRIREDRPGVAWNPAFGTPAFLDGRSLNAPKSGSDAQSAAQGLAARPGTRALAYIQANREIFKLRDPAAELNLREQHTDGLGSRHETFQQVLDGVPVWNGRITAHFDKAGTLYAVNACYPPTPALPSGAEWRLEGNKAVAAAVADLRLQSPLEDFDPETRALLEYAGPVAERNIWLDPESGVAHRAWRVEIRPNLCARWRYFIDAATGAILEKYNAANADGPKTANAADLLGTMRAINTYQVGSTYYLIDGTRQGFNSTGLPGTPRGALWTLNAANTDLVRVNQVTSTNNAWSDPAAVSAHYNMARVYEYYLQTFNRRGIDGAGGTMIAAVHVTMNGKPMDNAYWNGKLMAYGDGNRAFKPLARALDVAGHEMTHGVIEATVNLNYRSQSGALNESLADVFGAMIDRDDWKIGEDVVNAAASSSGALRDMQDPHNGGNGPTHPDWQPSHMLEYVKMALTEDNGGVHVNSGIPNRACYLIANAIGREKTEKIYYRVLDARYLNPGSQFLDMRLGAVRAATDLYGENSPEVAAVRDGFTAVGIGSATSNDIPTPRPPDREPVAGPQFVAYIGAKAGDSSLYLAKSVVSGDTDITHLTSTQVYTGSGRAVAASADGSLILFIDAKHALRAIDAAGERTVGPAGAWNSVAVSPDGALAAVTTRDPDGKIHLIDLAHPEQSRALQLYTPSAGQGAQTNNVVNADALEFDESGGNILYDALNRVPQAQGNPIEFWDVNLIELKSGVITPFLPSLPEGVSVGNPSFARTSSINVVFDLIDEFAGSFSVVAADLFTGTFRVIDSNAVVPGGPRYSTRDDKIVFTRAAGSALNVFQITMAKDKITPVGKAVSYVTNAQKPVWLVKGSRPVLTPKPEAGNPLAFGLMPEADGGLRLELSEPSEIKVTIHDAEGRLRGELARGRRGAGSHRLAWNASGPHGIYLVRLEAVPNAGPARTFVMKAVR
jgi:bacillolysin